LFHLSFREEFGNLKMVTIAAGKVTAPIKAKLIGNGNELKDTAFCPSKRRLGTQWILGIVEAQRRDRSII
jgi:hypothetical protein